MKKLYSKEIRDKYQDQKWMAKSRGIKFNLNIEQWVGWWRGNLGKDWLAKRGCKSGQYVMARLKDKGSYALENIMCITSNQNHADMKQNRSYAITNIKFPPEVIRELFLSKPNEQAALCKKYGTRHSYISMIKRREVWADLTANMGQAKLKTYGRGVTHPLATIDETIVRGIYLSKGTNAEIGEKYGVRKGLVSSIRTGGSWAAFTRTLGPIPGTKRGPYKKK